jgi:phage-related protein
MPANTAIIGRVAVKVMPDTRGFRKDAERQLNGIEKSLKMTVPTKIDMSGASREFLTELRKINQRNRNSDARKIRFHTTISNDGMRDAIVTARRRLQQLADQNKIDFKVENLDAGEITAKVKLNQDSLDEVKDALDRWKARVSPVIIDVRTDLNAASTAASSARLALLSRARTVPLLPEVSTAASAKAAAALAALSGARVIHTYFDNIVNSISNLDRSVPLIGTLSLAVAGLAGWGITAASNLASLAVSLAQIGPAALVLPGILGGIAIGVGVMVAALKDFNTVFPDVAAAFSAMQNTISANFWAEATAPIREMLDVLLPRLADGFAATATALGGYFAGIAAGVKDTLVGALDGMFADLASSIQIATGGTGALVGVITTLGQVGAGYLPQLATWFVDITTRFDEFLSQAAADGRLKGWIDTALVNIGALGSSLASIGGIIMAVGNAAQAAGGSSLVVFADTLNRIQAITEGPAFQGRLTEVFTAAHDAMSQIATFSGPAMTGFFKVLGETLTTLLPLVGAAIGTLLGSLASALSQPAFTGGLIAMFDGIAAAVQSLAPAFTPLAAALGALGPVIGAIAQVIASTLAVAIPPVSTAIQILALAVTPLISLLGTALQGAVTALAPVIVSLASAFAGLIGGGILPALQTAIGAILPVIQQLAPLIGQVLVTALNAITPILPIIAAAFGEVVAVLGDAVAQILPSINALLPVLAAALTTILAAVLPLIPQLLSLATSVLVPLIQAVAELAIEFLPKLAEAIQKIVPVASQMLGAIQAIWNFIAPVLIPVLQFLAGVLLDTVVTAINGVRNVVSGVLGYISGYFKVWKSLFTGDWKGAWDGIKQMVEGVWNIIKGAFQLFMTIGLLRVASLGLSAIKGIFKGSWNSIKAVIGAVWGAIKGAFSGFMNGIKGGVTGGMSSIKGAFSSAWETIKGIFRFAWAALKGAVKDGIDDVMGKVRAIPGTAASALAGIGGALISAGKSLIQGLIDGITGKIGEVKAKLGELTGMLPDWKGPAPVDKVLLFDAGSLIIEGLINGMESQYDGVKKSLTGLTKDIGSTLIDSPTMADIAAPNGAAARGLAGVAAASAATGDGAGDTKVLNYYAAPGSSLSSEEELFAATSRTRMVGW